MLVSCCKSGLDVGHTCACLIWDGDDQCAIYGLTQNTKPSLPSLPSLQSCSNLSRHGTSLNDAIDLDEMEDTEMAMGRLRR